MAFWNIVSHLNLYCPAEGKWLSSDVPFNMYPCFNHRFDPDTKQWSFIAPMTTARSTVGVAVLNGRLYAVGGRDGSACLNSVESYDPHTNKWSVNCPMMKRRGGKNLVGCQCWIQISQLPGMSVSQ